ncbi:glyoxylase-like metal-dependent hydrolase (beta-lactamase superfamily II) [Paenibacillus cellulosilyticus]|uniref:Glyoxylase-like metal-dependent hydrolase (Beta-lactamase superfamily II) n=1 Tax=Paenibacillus cellulosilyticus TaxID=375489 RepID=A0A2V2Z1A6_9BACL|nr:MBL fold metallo-hydrolase [Paenibacillus cellulosilyticus]PWW08592.1 glyoxylase-like metal-dependent hydrolase (beta-lactamase superfamily II) [Paenibacillus cellulosilyticus]QKS48161.1 MBL fold metallo-hydrolase [Paenibacillus cellulosilyticus]
MRVAQGIEMLELKLAHTQINPTVVYDADGYWLIDTGLPGSRNAIESLITEAGLDAGKLQGIILTHQDIDHVGGLPQWLDAPGGREIPVYAHLDDRGAIDGTAPMIKVGPERRASLLESMPEPVRQSFLNVFSGEHTNVTSVLSGGETLPFGGGLAVIPTPGHTPGHVSLYHVPSKTLIAGDALTAADGVLNGPNPPFTPDMPKALRSLRNLAPFEIEAVICYHGGLISGKEVQQRIAEIVSSEG